MDIIIGMSRKDKIFHLISLTIVIVLLAQIILPSVRSFAVDIVDYDYEIDLSDLSGCVKYTAVNGFTTDGEVPKGVYVTTFLYDGVDTVKTYDLDDYVKYAAGKSAQKPELAEISTTVVNINRTGNIRITGSLTDGMIAVNTNNLNGQINLYLDGVILDTNSKKFPAIYVYNKDINYNKCTVNIIPVEGTENYIEGGKFKKVSLMNKDNLSDYVSSYNNVRYTYKDDNGNEINTDVKFSDLSDYYGIYSSDEISNILFAQVKADSEGISDGDPTLFYKGSGAISSDISLNFQGKGFLSVKSKNKEGIETKGNLSISGGTGYYYVYAEDDCLNTTTSRDSSAYSTYSNDLTIDCELLAAIVDSSADEGDGIDSNGSLTINDGQIIAIACPGQDAGLDATNGVTINGGTILSTGDMFEGISSSSKQNFISLVFANQQPANTGIYLTDKNDESVIGYLSDRKFTNFVYSSPELKNGTYYLYKNGTIEGNIEAFSIEDNDFEVYTLFDGLEGSTQQQWTSSGSGKSQNNPTPGPDGNTNPPDLPSDNPSDDNTTTDEETGKAIELITTSKTLSNSAYTSITSDENVILINGKDISVGLNTISVEKTGDGTNEENCNFYGLNSAILVKGGSVTTIDNADIKTNAKGANGVFCYGGNGGINGASGDGTTLNISNSRISTTGDNSGGIMTAGGGITNIAKCYIDTYRESSAAIRTDRGGGTVSVEDGIYNTYDTGSPIIYSTADIKCKNIGGEAKNSQIAVIEGKNSLSINDSNLSCFAKGNRTSSISSDELLDSCGIMLYQSMSGDSLTGTSSFSVKDSTLIIDSESEYYDKAPMFFVTNTDANIELSNTELFFGSWVLLDVEGIEDSNGWGTANSNGGNVEFNANKQKLYGNIIVDDISSLNMKLSNGSSWEGKIDNNGGKVNLTLDSSSTISLNGDTYVTSLSNGNSSCSNINLNGHTLYVNGKGYKTLSALSKVVSSQVTNNSIKKFVGATEGAKEFILNDSQKVFYGIGNYAGALDEDDTTDNEDDTDDENNNDNNSSNNSNNNDNSSNNNSNNNNNSSNNNNNSNNNDNSSNSNNSNNSSDNSNNNNADSNNNNNNNNSNDSTSNNNSSTSTPNTSNNTSTTNTANNSSNSSSTNTSKNSTKTTNSTTISNLVDSTTANSSLPYSGPNAKKNIIMTCAIIFIIIANICYIKFKELS